MPKNQRLLGPGMCFAALLLAAYVAGCSSKPAEAAGGDAGLGADEAALAGYDAARGNKIADRAIALWNGKASKDLCLLGVRTTLEMSGVVTPAFPRLGSAAEWDDWARANPEELGARGFQKVDVAVSHIPRGSIITWRPGQCGYDGQLGYIEIVTDGPSSRACSDTCGSIKQDCGAPGIFVPVSTDGAGDGYTDGEGDGDGDGAEAGAVDAGHADAADGSAPADCSVHADGKLYCTNRSDTPVHAATNAASPVVNTLRTTYSWFDCWGTGERHAGGNTTWYHTLGDDNANRGWVPGVALLTPDAFDADPSARGLRRCP